MRFFYVVVARKWYLDKEFANRIDKNTPDANFRGLHDAFASDLVSGSFKKQKTSMDGEAPMNTPSVFDRHDQDAQDYEMQETLFQPIGADVVEQDENMDSPEEDIIFEVSLHPPVSQSRPHAAC